MTGFLHLQDEFADALLSVEAPVPVSVKGAVGRKASRRFAVYRNNVAAGLVEALGRRFPVLKRLVGDAFFSAMARSYVFREPPLSPLLIHYGETFAAFIEGFAPAKPLPYLADVARLEYARGCAYHAADTEPLPRAAFATLGERIGATQVTLHPSASILTSRYPILSIWQANQSESVAPVEEWVAESVLVARPFLEVEMRRLGAGIDAFLTALRSRMTIAEAAEAGEAAAPDFDPAGALAVLIGESLAVALSG
jgi:hypothetical protein